MDGPFGRGGGGCTTPILGTLCRWTLGFDHHLQTATSQEPLDCNHSKAHDFNKEWEGVGGGGGMAARKWGAKAGGGGERTSGDEFMPSIWLSSSLLSRREASCSVEEPRAIISASISSKKIVDGACCLATCEAVEGLGHRRCALVSLQGCACQWVRGWGVTSETHIPTTEFWETPGGKRGCHQGQMNTPVDTSRCAHVFAFGGGYPPRVD